MPRLDPDEMARRGRLGAQATLDRHDARALTAAGRRAFLDKFPDDESRRQHFRELGIRSAERRAGGIVLSADEAAALGQAYDLLRRVAASHPAKLGGIASDEGGGA